MKSPVKALAENKRSISLMAASALFFALPAQADRIADLYPSDARALSMGGAGIATASDAYAVFYNPANLASKSTRPRIEPLNLIADTTGSGLSILGNKKNAMNLGSSYSYLKSNPGQWSGYRIGAYPNITTRFFSLGFLYTASYSAKYNEADSVSGAPVSVRRVGYREFGPVVALAQRFYGGVVKLGAAARLTQAGSIRETITSPDTKSLSYSDGFNNVTSLKLSAGLTLAVPVAHIPTFSVVARNFGNTQYPQGTLPLQLDAGFGYVTYIGRFLHFRLGADYRDFTNALGAGTMRKLFVGGEWKFFNILSLRGGYGQGYPSAGIGVDVGRIKFDFSWYSEEMADGLRSDRNQHYMVQIIWSLFN